MKRLLTAKEVRAAVSRLGKPGRVRNVKRVEYGGRTYTAGEARHAQRLDLWLKAGEIVGWEPQVRLPLFVNERLVTTYVADFVVTPTTGALLVEVHEVKGSWRTTGNRERFVNDAWPLKARLLQALRPDLRLRVFKPNGEEMPAPTLRDVPTRTAAAPRSATAAPRRRSRGAS